MADDQTVTAVPGLPSWMQLDKPAPPPPPAPPEQFPISEASRRRPDFIGGEEVVLADGQKWIVPRPRARFGLDDGERGLTKVLAFACVGGRFVVDESFQKLCDELDEARNALVATEAVPEYVRTVEAELRLAHAFLLRNYELTAGELAELVLLSWDGENDPEGAALRDAFTWLREGVAPKAKGEPSV